MFIHENAFENIKKYRIKDKSATFEVDMCI